MKNQVNYLIQIVESILQFRLQKKKNNLQHLCFIRNQIRKSYKSQAYDQTILSSLVLQQSYQVRSKIISLGYGKLTSINQEISLRLTFKAIEKSTSKQINQENWLFLLKENSQYSLSNKKTSDLPLLDLVDHIIRHLIYFELTPQTKDRGSEKNRYLVDYIIQIGKPRQYQNSILLKKNLWQKKVYSKGQNQAYLLQVICFYQDHNLENCQLSNSFCSNKKNSLKSIEQQTTIGTRRVSIFEIYDQDLQMTMLSGDNSMKSDKKISEICLELEEQQQFQLLIQQTKTQDQIFLEQNTELLKQMAMLQDQHFNE